MRVVHYWKQCADPIDIVDGPVDYTYPFTVDGEPVTVRALRVKRLGSESTEHRSLYALGLAPGDNGQQSGNFIVRPTSA